jgi:hypothetical protein
MELGKRGYEVEQRTLDLGVDEEDGESSEDGSESETDSDSDRH